MKIKILFVALVVTVAIGAGGYGLYRLGLNHAMQMNGTTSIVAPVAPLAAGASRTSDGESTTGKKVLYWHDPMAPGQKFDKPGKSPFMDMQLVPVYAENGGDEGAVTVSPRMQQNLGVRTAEVTMGTMTPAVEAVGTVAYNERDVAVVQARSNGFVERLFVRAPLDPVRQGQPLAELYVPEWVAAQEEYLSVARMAGAGMDALKDGARQRMRLAGMTEAQIQSVIASGKVQARFTVTAPIGGVVAELSAREGMTVMAGAPLFRVNGLSTIWVNAEVPESLAAQVRPGSAVEARAPALAGTIFKGKVTAILPEVNPATRTLKVRVELDNPAGTLVPGMFATVVFKPSSRTELLQVPSEAVITTGKRNVVIVAQAGGKFAPVDVEVGMEVNGQTEIRKGLDVGQKVVVSGQFLIDSEASLKGVTTRMGAAPAATTEIAGGATHHGEGKVESITRDEIMLSHGPILSLQWGAMTMGFKPPANGLPKNVTVGGTVMFDIRSLPGGAFEITAIHPMPPAPAGNATDGTQKPDIKRITK